MYQLIFLDYCMPDMDGPQVAVEIRKRFQQRGFKIPYICCCTANTAATFKQMALT